MHHLKRGVPICILLIPFCSIPALTRGVPEAGKIQPRAKITSSFITQKALQGYNLKLWLSNQMTMGIEAWLPNPIPGTGCPGTSPGIGMEYPAGSCVEHLWGMRLIFGGIIDGVKHASGVFNGFDGTFSGGEEKPDTIHDNIWKTHSGQEEYHPNGDGYSGYYYDHSIIVNRRGYDDDGDGRTDEDELDGKDNDGDWNPLFDDIGADGLPDSLEVSCDGKPYDPITNPDPAYDNYEPTAIDSCHPVAGVYNLKNDKRKYTQNNGIPDHGEPHVDEDYGAVSDNDLYLSGTDTIPGYGYVPMGIRAFMKTYAWDNSFLNSIIPIDYIFTDIGANTIDSVYLGFLPDFDVGPVSIPGYQAHDYACYSSDLHCAYIDNSVDSGSTPAGLVLLATPSPLDSLHFTWAWQLFFTSPDSVMYRLLSGEAFTGSSIRPCQLPSSPTDTRFLYAFGPFRVMHPGDSLKISIALVSGTSLTDMFDNAQRAHDLFANNYLVAVKDKREMQPAGFRLQQNYPNPFNPSTRISYSIRYRSHVQIRVYNILGQLVSQLVNDDRAPGNYSTDWDASGIASGVYFYRITAGRFTDTKKMLYLR